MSIGANTIRKDAYQKASGKAKYTADLLPQDYLVAKIVHSTIANGLVKKIDISKAAALPGVIKIITCFDVPKQPFPTAGHPWSTDPNHQDIADRLLLNQRVRQYGDDIAAIIAIDEITAAKAHDLIEVSYQEFLPLLTAEQAIASKAEPLHQGFKQNIVASHQDCFGDFDALAADQELIYAKGSFTTQQVQHCHLETAVSFAYMEDDRITVYSSTQIPHIVRRVCGQALNIPWGKIRVIKPYIGGGFGNKQEVLYEPLNAYLTTQVGGRCVKLELSREEVFSSTRSRHRIDMELATYLKPDGKIVGRKLNAYSHQGAYASHGHAIVANATNCFRQLYPYVDALSIEATTVYTNLSTTGAMRGYGIPQIVFAMESHLDDIAKKHNLDPLTLRLNNMMQEGYIDSSTGIKAHSSGLKECIEKGRKFIDWDQKRTLYQQEQNGRLRRGIGMAILCYKTGVYPISLETASARLVLNQDGSVQLQMGATEIGQGADTVFSQMAAEVLNISIENIHIISQQDTDITPFDTGAYASRQSYVSGMALKKTALLFKQRILEFAALFSGIAQDKLDISQDNIIHTDDQQIVCSMAELALNAFYHPENSRHIMAQASNHCTNNSFSFGVCFAEIEVDIYLGKIKILNIINVHDSGRLLNPALATAQVHGGMSMGLGYALSEQMLFNEQGRLLNGNFLDYKLPTALDSPDLGVDFVEAIDDTSPFGNKSLGEPPAIPLAAAIRNALLQATGIGLNSLPLNPPKLIAAFKEGGLFDKGGR